MWLSQVGLLHKGKCGTETKRQNEKTINKYNIWSFFTPRGEGGQDTWSFFTSRGGGWTGYILKFALHQQLVPPLGFDRYKCYHVD